MAYTKTIWSNNELPAIDADNLNNIENGIKANETKIDSLVLGENLKGEFTPSISQEYPLSPAINDSWYIDGLTGAGYEFTTGVLIGQVADNFDKLVYISTGWFLVEDTQNYVHNTGDETIAGIKTFTSSPIIPDPTTPQQPVSKQHLEDTTYTQTEIDTAVAERRKLYAKETTTHDFTADADYTLTVDQNRYGRIVLTDTNPFLTVARNIITDNVQKSFTVQNDTLQDITVKTTAGTGIPISAGAYANLYNDGVNIESLDNAISILSTENLLMITDEKATGTDGGSSTATTYHTRVLNTVILNNISGASLATNQVTLPAGTYYVEASAPCVKGTRHRASIYNVTDVAYDLYGENAYSDPSIVSNSRAEVHGVLTIASTKVFELRHYITTALITIGLGTRLDDGIVEKYSEIKIWKVA